MQRVEIRFPSGDTECAAWHYPGRTGACVVMAGGFAVPKEPATDRFAEAFQAAGFSVLAFDYRGIGASGGQPRLVQRIPDLLADWHAAVGAAADLPGVDPGRLALWGFSASGGHVFPVAAGDPRVAAAISQAPNADGRAGTLNALRHQTIPAAVRLLGRGLLDALGGLVGRAPLLVPLEGPPGTVAVLTTPDAIGGGEVLAPGDRYPQWQRAVAARSVLALGRYRPGRWAGRVTCPLLVVVCDDDRTALAAPAAAAAGRAPHGELVRLPGGHYAPFLDQFDAAVAAEVAFLRRVLESPPGPDDPRPPRRAAAAGSRGDQRTV